MSPATRFVAPEKKATWRPSSETAATSLWSSDGPPSRPTVTSTVLPDWRSRRKMSSLPLVSPSTRSVASLVKASQRPSPLSDASTLDPFPGSPPTPTLSSVVAPVRVSRTYICECSPLVPGARFVANEKNATYRPSADSASG